MWGLWLACFSEKLYESLRRFKKQSKILSKNGNDACSQWITIEAVKQTEDGGERLVIRDYISSTDPAVDYRYSAYFPFDDPILDEVVIQADNIFEDHRILSSVKIDLCQMFSAISISED